VAGQDDARDEVRNAAMGLIFSILMLGLMASLSPATIVVFILVLGTTRARVNAAAFLVGWGASLTVVFAVSYLLGSSRSAQHGNGRTAVIVLEIALGCVLLVTAVRRLRHPAEVSDGTTGWGSALMARTNDLGPRGAAVVGVLKQPWAITTAAAVLVVHHHEPGLVALIAFACFTIASTASVGLMYVYYTRRPEEATAYLSDVRDRAMASGPTVFAVAATVVGAFLLVDGLTDLLV
jgi:hypothetical protein